MYNWTSDITSSYVTDMLQKKLSQASSHTPCLLSIDLHTVRQHLEIARLLSGTLFQMMSGVSHHCHHLILVWRHSFFVQFIKTEHSHWSLYICAWIGLVIYLLMVFLNNALMCMKEIKLITSWLSAYFNALENNAVYDACRLNAVYCLISCCMLVWC